MNIKLFLKNLRKNPDNPVTPDNRIKNGMKTAHINSAEIKERFSYIYGEELMRLQLLYENWAVKESWLIKEEALPLMVAIDPNSLPACESDIENLLNESWMHAKSCVEQGLLQVINREDKPEQWRAKPLDIYRWAKISRIPCPDTLATLMEFVSNTIKQTDEYHSHINSDLTAAKFDKDRERILGMALAILAAYPDKCRNNKGRVKVDRILDIINEKRSHWLGDEELSMSTTVIRDLISKWLNTLPVQTD